MANLTRKDVETHVKGALSKLRTNISNVTEYQLKALLSFLNKRDTFVSLPTGYGKSLIYQISIGVFREIEQEQEPVIVVVSPLNALIRDQIQSCSEMGINACKLDGESLNNFDQVSKSSLIYTSPEVLESIAGRKFIQKIRERLVGIVIDESHCIVNWGLKSSSGEVFRQSYGQVGNVRAFTKAPILCLTATASVAVRKKILKLLHMKNAKIIKLSPEKANIKITVRKAEKDLEETFKWLLEELNFQKDRTEKTIVYCQTISDCGELYSLFDEINSDVKRFAMYHSKTPVDVQNHVLTQFTEMDSQIRVVFATSALGMGVNVPDVRRIIHYGIPRDLEQYVQEIGRSGRDGEQSAAILLYRPYHLAHCDNDMREFVKNNERCRRKIIAEYFKEKPLSIDVKHNCCDKCAEGCDCMMQSCSDTKTNSHNENMTIKGKCCRTVEPCDYALLKEILQELRDTYKSDVSILGMNALSSLTDAAITDLLNNCRYIFTSDDVIEYTGILDEGLVHEVLIAFNDVFDGDISEYELCKTVALDLPEMELDRYETVPDWCTVEGFHSDYEEQANSSDSV